MMSCTIQEILTAQGARFSERAGRRVAIDFGDAAAEVKAAREGTVVFDLSHRRLLALTDEDRVRFLNGMITMDVAALKPGRGHYALLCDVKGKVLADFYVWALEEELLLECDPELFRKIRDTLERFIIADYVELEDRTDTRALFHLAGPKAGEVLAGLGVAVPAKPRAAEATKIADVPAEVAANDRAGLRGFDLWCAPESAAALWEALRRAGARAAGEEAFNLLLLEAGIPRYGIDVTEKNLPQEAELRHAFSTTKGCYVGQEVICKIQSYAHVNKHLKGFVLEGDRLPPAEAKLFAGDKEVGYLTQAARSPTLDRLVALGYVKHGAVEQGVDLSALEVRWDGEATRAALRDLPLVQ